MIMSKNKFNTFKYLIRALVFIVGFITIFWYVLFDPPVTQFELDSQDTIWSSPLTIHTSGNKKGLMSLWVKNNIFTKLKDTIYFPKSQNNQCRQMTVALF